MKKMSLLNIFIVYILVGVIVISMFPGLSLMSSVEIFGAILIFPYFLILTFLNGYFIYGLFMIGGGVMTFYIVKFFIKKFILGGKK